MNNSTATTGLGTLSLLLAIHARERPAHLAVVYEDRRLSYRDLELVGRRIAGHLQKIGIGPGARVGLLAKNCDAYYELLAGCSAARAVLTPVNWRLAHQEIEFILKDADVQALFVSQEYITTAAPIMAAIGCSDRLFLLDGAPAAGAGDYGLWRDGGEPLASPESQPDDVLLQIYSSGTTGSPKGVELTQAAFLAAADQIRHGLVGRWTDADRLLVALPLFHAGALLTASYALLAGGSAVVLPNADIGVLLRVAITHGATKVGFVPALMQGVLEHPDFGPCSLPNVDTIIYGGSAISADLLDRAVGRFGEALVQLFGSSETFTAGTVLTGAGHQNLAKRASCGQAMQGIDIRIIRLDGTRANIDEPGEILIRSPTLMKGYWGRPEQTAEVLQNGWYRTGDVGSLDADGFLTIRDRLRDMIISGGENIYPVEIENVLSRHPDVADCAVIGVPDPRWGESVKAIVVPGPDARPDADALISYLQENLARYKCPRSVEFVDTLPRNATGKVLKRVLRDSCRKQVPA